MFFDNNDFADLNSGYSIPENNNFDLNGYPLEPTYGEPSIDPAWVGGFDLNATVTSPTTAEITNWWLAPRPEGDVNGYLGSTLLGSSVGECAGVSGYQTEPTSTSGAGSCNADGTYGFGALGQQPIYMPDYAGLVPVPTAPAQLPSHFPATFAGPRLTPSPVLTISWPSPPPSTSYLDPGNSRSSMYDQPLAAPEVRNKWPYQIPIGKGKSQATAKPLPTHPLSAGNAMWQHQQTYMPQDYGAGSNLQMGTGVPNIDLPAPVAPSTGPQRPVRGAKGKGKEIDKGEGKRKRVPKAPLPPGVDWPDTTGRFCAEMVNIFFNQPTGEVPNPETAYARINEFVKEDLKLSPLVGKTSEQRPCRDLEQYLTGVLNELCPRRSGQKRGARYMLERVANKLENELVVVNDGFALLEGPSNEVDPEKLDVSEAAVNRRLKEQARRGAIRGSLERMTLFFKIPTAKFQWSRPQALVLAITYLVIGVGAFGDEVELFTPKPRL